MSSSEEKSATEDVVEEKGRSTGNLSFILLFYFLGTACFIPSSFFVTANKYWMYKFRDSSLPFNETDTAEKTTLQKNFTSYSGVTGNVATVVFLFVTILLRNIIKLQARIIGSMIFLIACFALTLLFIFIDTDSWQMGFFVLVLIIGVLLNCGTAVLTVSVFQLAIKFPPRCLGAQFAGQPVCGIFAAAIQVLSLLVASSITVTTALFYSVATGGMIVILAVYIFVLYRSESFRRQLKSKPKKVEALKEKPILKFSMVIDMVKRIRFYIGSLVICVGNTLMLHPGLTILAESSEKGVSDWGDTYFIPVSVFLLYNIFEFGGREISNYFMKWNNIKLIFAVAIVRLILFPLILFCNIQPRKSLPVWFEDDAVFIIFLIILAFSSGYLLNVSLVKHAECCEPKEKWLASASITVIMLVSTPIFVLLNGVFINLI